MGLSGRPIRILGVLLLLVVGAVLSGCAASLPQTPFDPAGPVAQWQLDLLKLTLWFAIGIGILVSGILIYVVWRFRDRDPKDKSVPEQVQGNHTLEVIWTIIPIVILVVVAIPTVQVAFKAHTTSAADALEVSVKAHQWWFAFEYPETGVVTANELYIPVGKDVRISLQSNDVIHSFWVPKLAGKVDLIPGRTNQMWFRADRAEVYYGQCAEFCGAAHAQMRFRVIAVEQAEFDAWMARQQKGEAIPTAGQEKLGYELFMGATPSKATCITCHAINGTKAEGKIGPDLTNFGERSTLAAGVYENTEAHLKQWIRQPKEMKPGVVVMPAHPNLTDEELDAIIAYLQTLGK